MHRIDSATAQSDLHGTGKDGFTNGTPGLALDDPDFVPATKTTADIFNALQEEPANAIEMNGGALDNTNNFQLAGIIRGFLDGNWTARTSGSAQNVLGLVYDSVEGYWLGCLGNGKILRSNNGVSWEPVIDCAAVAMQAIVAQVFDSDFRLMVVGVDGEIWQSGDHGTTWSLMSSPTEEVLRAICLVPEYGFLAVGDAQTIVEFAGIAWTGPWTLPASVTSHLGRFVGVASSSTKLVVANQLDGGGEDGFLVGTVNADPALFKASLQFVAAPADFTPNAVVWSERHQLFVAVGTGGKVYTSPTGTAWTLRAQFGGELVSVAVTPAGALIAGGLSGLLATSVNALSWTRKQAHTDEVIRGAAYGLGQWVICGSNGYVATSLRV